MVLPLWYMYVSESEKAIARQSWYSAFILRSQVTSSFARLKVSVPNNCGGDSWNRTVNPLQLPFLSLNRRYISPTNPQFSTHRSSCATSTDQPEIPPKMSSENKQQVTLRASDDGTYTVERVVAEKSGLINQMIEGESSLAL